MFRGVVKTSARHLDCLRCSSMLSNAASLSSTPKPPNVLIYQPDRSTAGKEFSRVKESLEYCLTPEHYVIYPLGEDEIVQYSPWKDNCRLFVIPGLTEHAQKHLSPRVMDEMISYIQAGGKLLSMHSELNRVLGLRSFWEVMDEQCRDLSEENSVKAAYCEDGVCDVEVWRGMERESSGMEQGQGSNGQSNRFSCLVPASNGMGSKPADVYWNEVSLRKSIVSSTEEGFLIPVERNTDMGQTTNQSNSNQSDHEESLRSHDPPLSCACVRKVVFATNGCAVLANVDLCPVLPHGLGVSALLRLKRGVASRGRYLTLLLRMLGLECSEDQLPSLSHTYLICSQQRRSQFLSAVEPRLLHSTLPGKDLSLVFITTDYSTGTPVDDPQRPSTSELTVITNPAPWQLKSLPFSPAEYFQRLETSDLGRTLLHSPVITSTQLPFMGNDTFCQLLTQKMGVVWVTAQQTQGKGRSGNMWLSPLGSMMFTAPLHLAPESRLSHHLPLLQHIVGVAVVHGVRSLPGYESLQIRIKWPNDIYYESRVKLGGILVSCLSLGNSSAHTAIIGCGVNVSNKYPTLSLNDAITLHNQQNASSLPPLSVETVLGATFNTLETLLASYEVRGVEPLLALYYKYWLHRDAVVSLASYGEKATVIGLDKYGYLQVRREGGEMVSLQPDGNSFDIMKGLITMKT